MASQQFLTEAYLAYFGRPVDVTGLAYWATRSEAEVIAGFSASEESRALYGEQFSANQINAIYNNLFNRDAEPEGLKYWLDEVFSGRVTPPEAALRILEGALNDDKTFVENKLAASEMFTAGLDTTAEMLGYDGNEAAAAARAFLATVTTDVPAQDQVDAAVANVTAIGGAPGTTYTLTKGMDTVPGTSGNDVIIGSVDAANPELNTLSAIDVINGGGGIDTLKISAVSALTNANLPTLSSVEVVEVSGVAAVTLDTAGVAGVTDLNVVKAGGALNAAAGATTNISVSGAADAITVNGGKNVTVTDATAGKDIAIGGTTASTGTVTVTDSKVGAGTITVDGGTDVTIVATGSSGGADHIKVGQTTAATGAVSVTSNHTGVAATDVTLNAITVTGGSTITVAQTADGSKAAADKTGATLTQGDVTVTGGNGTTSVTVTQAQSAAEVTAAAAVAGVTETASVKFSALNANETLIIDADGSGGATAGDLTFTAAKNLTAEEVAQAFANLTSPDAQGSGIVANGVYTLTGGATNFLSGWTSGAAVGDTVVFTSATANTNVGNLEFKGTGTAPVVTTTDGSAAVAAQSGVLGVKNGAVTIDDAATAAITTVTLDGYGTTNIGGTNTLSKLQTLNLSNSGSSTTAGDQDAAVTVDAVGVTALALNLNNVQGAVSLDGGGASVQTLNITTSGANSKSGLTAAAVETLTIAGDKSVDLSSGSTLTALKSVTISGAAGANLAAAGLANLTSINAAGTSGAVTATVDGTRATYTGGSGVDSVTIGTDVIKAVSLGAGDDRLNLTKSDLAVPTVVLDGGEGTDTLVLNAAAAATLSGSVLFKGQVSGFERLELAAAGDDDDAADTVTVNLENLGFTNYVTTNGTVADTSTPAKSDTLVLDNLASGGTVVIAAAAAGANTKQTVQIKDAAAGTADVLNLVISSAGDLNAGTLTAANVETINLTATDTNTKNGINSDVLTLTADKATSITVSGNANLELTLTGSTAVTSIDGSAMTGNLTVTSLNTTSATTINGGSGNDRLEAATGTTADVLNGGAGNDTLVANAGLSTLTGGAGNDWFVIGVASQNVNSYATITDFGAGDVLQLVGADSFASAAVTLGATAVFQDYANAAINLLGANDAGWFQFEGNTYVVADMGANGTSFDNGQDFIVQLTGLIDLSQASFNATSGTIELV